MTFAMVVMPSDVPAIEYAAHLMRALLLAFYLDPCIARAGRAMIQMPPQPSPPVLVETQQREGCHRGPRPSLHPLAVAQVWTVRGSRIRLVSEGLQGLVTKSRAPGLSDTLKCAQT